jgi:outer membrane protein assembly factor BamA
MSGGWPLALFALLSLPAGCAHQMPERWVDSFRIEGNRAFSDRELRSVLATRPTGWWPLATRQPFDRAAFELDLQRIPAFYADHGYFRARVTGHDIRERPGGAVDLTVTVDEGRPTFVEQVALEGFPDARQEKAVRRRARALDVEPGDRVDYVDYTQLKEEAVEVMRQQGHAYAELEAEIAVDRDRRAATVSLRALPGPLVHFGQVRIEGHGDLPEWKLRRRVSWEPGERFDPDDLAVTQARLYDSGVFAAVRLTLPPEPTEVADVVIETVPGRLHELRLGGGVAIEREREEVRLRAVWTFSNFLGGLRRLQLRARPAYVIVPSITDPQQNGPAVDLGAQLSQPDIFATRMTLHALAGFQLLVSEGYQAYGPRGQLGLDRFLVRDRLLLAASWNLEFLRFFNINRAVFDPTSTVLGFGFTNPYRLAYLEELIQLDLRDNPFSPRYGGFAAARFEQGSPLVGGEFRYSKITPEARLYAPLGRRVVLAARGLVGWLWPMGEDGAATDSPVTRRYALGGPASHRGFSFGRLAPQQADNDGDLIPVGGDGQVLFSAEARVNVVRLSGNWLGLTPFLDAGDVTPRFDQLDLGNLHYATGLDLDYATIIGIVRAGFGIRLNRVSGTVVPGQSPANPDPGQRWAVHLTLGEAF